MKYHFLLPLIALAMLTDSLYLQAKKNATDEVLHRKDSLFFLSPEAKQIGDLLLFYQRDTGGWPKNVDMITPLSTEQQDSVIQQKSRRNDSTIDNNATTMQMTFLARLFQQTKDNRYREAFRKAINFLLNGQYDNGGWPQFWPENRDYQTDITFNDNAIVNVLRILRDVMKDKEPYNNGLIDTPMQEAAERAFKKGIQCILATQIRIEEEPTVWCQQHDRTTLQPSKARAYELPSFCTQESAAIVFLLMQIPNPDASIIRSVNGAMKWFDEHKITGYRVEKFKVEGKSDIRLVEDSYAMPLWARYYDLAEGKPTFSDRDGKPKRSIMDIGRERRKGYDWYNDKPLKLYDRYEKWATKNNIANKLTFK